NLLSNAFKFTPNGGRIRLSLLGVDDRFRVEVADSGEGIPADKRSEVFERFQRLSSGTIRRLPGTRLGLSIVRDFTALLSGRVSVADAPEGGALSVLDLPIAPPPGATIRPPLTIETDSCQIDQQIDDLRDPDTVAPASDEEHAPHVLVVEDNHDLN